MADKHRTRRWRASVQRGTIYRSLGYFDTYEGAKVRTCTRVAII
jgi:hypothetical protein